MIARARRRVEEGERLADQLRALAEAADLCEGRVPDELVAGARAVVQRADRRLAVSGGATVVALAGATGSGKSTLFNVLSGSDLATTGVRRPTTSHPVATTFGTGAAEELLDWLEVPRRHGVPASDEQRDQGANLDGLVLLDLPDHDSTEVAHRLEVDRLVQLVDVLVWVVDPQKYADAALHDRYLKPLSSHAGSMLVVLNQADKLTPAERSACVADLRRLLASEGLSAVDVLALSAATGSGVSGLRRTLAHTVAGKKSAVRRLAADVAAAATRLAEASGTAEARPVGKAATAQLGAALAAAAGVDVVGRAVGEAWRYRGGLATGWPVLAWLARLRPDPLRRLHLDRLGAGGRTKEIDPTDVGRSALPQASGVQQARVEGAVRALADQSSTGLTRGWAAAVRGAARSNAAALPDRLDRTVATTDLGVAGGRWWWQAVRVLQWLLLAAVVAGLGWLAVAFGVLWLQLPPLPDVRWWGLPAPTVLAVGGVLAGLLVAALSRVGVVVGARRRQRQAVRTLRDRVAAVGAELVVAPVDAELGRYGAATAALQRARAG